MMHTFPLSNSLSHSSLPLLTVSSVILDSVVLLSPSHSCTKCQTKVDISFKMLVIQKHSTLTVSSFKQVCFTGLLTFFMFVMVHTCIPCYFCDCGYDIIHFNHKINTTILNKNTLKITVHVVNAEGLSGEKTSGHTRVYTNMIL